MWSNLKHLDSTFWSGKKKVREVLRGVQKMVGGVTYSSVQKKEVLGGVEEVTRR